MITKQNKAITEEITALYNSLSEAGNLPEDEIIYNKIEELEKILNQN
jgi:hypothetical protein